MSGPVQTWRILHAMANNSALTVDPEARSFCVYQNTLHFYCFRGFVFNLVLEFCLLFILFFVISALVHTEGTQKRYRNNLKRGH